MTAEEAYAKTIKARRNYVLEQIEASSCNCQFETREYGIRIYTKSLKTNLSPMAILFPIKETVL